jgi:inosose dehydratase
MSSRRKFLQTTALSVTAAGFGSLAKAAVPFPAQDHKLLDVGMAGYTFLNFNVEQTIAMMKRTGVSFLSIKDFHLPLNSNADKIAEVKQQFNAGGITIYAAGVIYMKSKEEVDRAFAYAKNLGVDLIVGVPTVELLPYTEEKVKQYNIRVAIHNHGPEDKLYPSPSNVITHIEKMDKRMGLCLDIGHSLRAGTDPAKAVKDYGSRIFDLHIKDLKSNAKDAKATELGRGVIDLPALVKALNKAKFAGKCSIEFEMDMKDPLPGIAESVGYFHAVNKLLS